MNTVKRILAILALICGAAALIAFVVVLAMGQLMEKFAWVMVPVSAFFMLGLITIAINYLQKLKAEADKKRAEGK